MGLRVTHYCSKMHPTEPGHITLIIRDEYIKHQRKTALNRERGPFNNERTLSLNADPVADRIYFWQLFGVLGKENILRIVTTFYENVFSDKEDWFREAFEESGDIEYHIKGQSYFWFDAMGGGRYYRGGKKLLSMKHSHVSEIMNSEGAERWMYHMYRCLKTNLAMLSEDPRVIPCILDFLQYFMDEYAITFDFNFVKIRSNL
jgi:truncated hemoglobin YjbI